jgi:hypothetical protein
MDNDGKAVLRKQRFDRNPVSQIEFFKNEIWITPENFEASFLKARIVVVVDDIKTNNLAASRQQALHHVKADKARSPGD